jgi:dihydrofolate reductase
MYRSGMEKAIAICPTDQHVYIIGGIYNLNFFSDKIELTRVHHDFEADAFFPEINPSDWEMIFSEFKQKMTNTYLITPIKRTLENKKTPHKLGCFFFTNDWEMAYS